MSSSRRPHGSVSLRKQQWLIETYAALSPVGRAAIDLALRCDGGYRIPEPTRRAHLLVNEMRRNAK